MTITVTLFLFHPVLCISRAVNTVCLSLWNKCLVCLASHALSQNIQHDSAKWTHTHTHGVSHTANICPYLQSRGSVGAECCLDSVGGAGGGGAVVVSNGVF